MIIGLILICIIGELIKMNDIIIWTSVSMGRFVSINTDISEQKVETNEDKIVLGGQKL